ncbi:MAG: RNA polymerase sigma 28 subunit FliA/WhiG subfamily [Ignavibacteria bacterium]|nr:MAG: RNA polymerase sigma 28 subunit FliA/WhiG subfamily [Ignavibacteria bacterium]
MSNAALWASYKEKPSPELKKQIVLNYVNLVHYVIHRTNLIQSALLDRRDYFQFGIEGLSEAIDRFDPDYGTKFETYAIQRIRGKIYDELRKYNDKFEHVLEPEATTMFPTSTLSVNQSIGEDDRLLDMIKELNERERTILSLYYYEDLNYKDIAQVLSITVSRVSQIHSRILNSLKLKLAKYNA